MCKVVNMCDDYDIYVGRPSKFGNPYSHLDISVAQFKVKNIDESLYKYEEYLLSNSDLYNSLYELKYKKIACWCKTKKCHAYILKKYVDKLEQLDDKKSLLDF